MTDARYVASKMGADLRNLNARYAEPSLSMIDKYMDEVALYLKAGYLDSVDFGFKDETRWILRLRYRAVAGGQLSDGTPGKLPGALEIAGYPFHSYLTHNSAFSGLDPAARTAFKATLPISRTAGTAPTANAGTHSNSSQYSRNGTGLDRDVYRAS